MSIPRRVGITIDCPDPEELADFWERFLGYTRSDGPSDGTYVTLEGSDAVEGPPHLTFQRVPEPKTTKTRIHLDLFVDAAEAMVEEMLRCGALVVSQTEAGEWTTRVLQDPAGNEFCVIGPD
jgi:predicted enzyme related to lactoylglutathione lyase